jgi:hypothetical protein
MSKQFFLLLMMILINAQLSAEQNTSSGGPLIIKIFPERQAERRQSRWTLDSWMQTKAEIARQDQWLWAHTNKIPLEFSLAYTQSPSRWSVESHVFIARLGLALSHSRSSEWFTDYNISDHGPQDNTSQVAAQIRIFGGNLQDSYLITRVGYEYSDFQNSGSLGGSFGTWYVEPELQIYLAQWIGVRGNLKQRWAGSHVTRKTQKFSGRNYTSAAFLELGALRFEAGYRWLEWSVDNVSPQPLKAEELFGALKLFF